MKLFFLLLFFNCGFYYLNFAIFSTFNFKLKKIVNQQMLDSHYNEGKNSSMGDKKIFCGSC